MSARGHDTPVEIPETHYARSGDLSIAYQVIGDGPLDLVLVPGFGRFRTGADVRSGAAAYSFPAD